jgi:1,2-diacylglycerol 3-beta-glucosyltransferase
MIIELIDLVFLGIAGACTLYLLALSVAAALYRRQKDFPSTRRRRFAVIIPAHNEEVSIARTITNLQQLEYPRHLYEIIVVADNCTDATASISRDNNVRTYERTDNLLRGKGHALAWILERLAGGGTTFDAVVIIDADSVAEPDFLTVMNYYVEHGSAAIQGNDLVEPHPGSWITEAVRLGFTLYNHVRPLGQRTLGFSCGLRGNGMCFTVSTLRRFPWNAYTLNEDLEYGLQLLLEGVAVDFAPEAHVYATMPSSPRTAESQRTRWERGRLPVMRKYSLPLLVSFARRHSWRAFGALIDLFIPPSVNLAAFTLIMTAANLLLWLAGIGHPAMVAGWTAVMLCHVVYVFGGLRAVRADKGLYATILSVPRYALWKALLYGKLLFRKNSGEWIRTQREPAPANPERAPAQQASPFHNQSESLHA